jgi:hypothetical protein
MIDLNFLSVKKLKPDTELMPFDCGDADLNSFLSEDAKNYYESLNQPICRYYYHRHNI